MNAEITKRKITVVGLGYVGLSNAVLLAQRHSVTAVDIVEEKVEMVNRRQSPIRDAEIEDYLENRTLDLKATTQTEDAYRDAEFVVVATPTNYDPSKNYFDTVSIETVIKQVTAINPQAVIVIKSTVPVGYTQSIQEEFNSENILFSPEFLREGKALYDCLYPSRIIVGVSGGNQRLDGSRRGFRGPAHAVRAQGRYPRPAI